MPFWYNVSTRQVESEENRGPASELLGPFDTRAEAEAALESAHERIEQADREDATWTRGDG